MQKMRSRAKTLFGCTAPGQVEDEFLGTSSISSSSTSSSAKSAPPALNSSSVRSKPSRSFLDLNDSFLDLNHDNNSSPLIRPGGSRRFYATPPNSQVYATSSTPTIAVADSPTDLNPTKPKIQTGATRRHIVPSQQQSESSSTSVHMETEGSDMVPPSLRISTTSQPSSPVSSPSSSPLNRSVHPALTPVPSTRHTRAPSAPLATAEPSPSPISESARHVPIDTAKDLPPLPPPSPPPFPTSSRRPSRTLPSPPTSQPASARLPCVQVSTARRRLPSLPCLPFAYPSEPPPPFPLPVPPSQFLAPSPHELTHSSSSSTLRTRRFSTMSDAETLPPYTLESPLSLTVT